VERFVSSSGGKIFGVGGDGNSVNSSIMRSKGRSNLEVGIPNFKSSIPTDRGEVRFKGNFRLSFKERRVSYA